MVYKWCRRHGLDPEDAADASQETFTSLLQKLGAYDPELSSGTFRAWLWTVTRNKAIDFHRQKKSPQARGGTANVAALADLYSSSSASSSASAGSSESTSAAESSSTDRCEVLRRALTMLRPRFEKQTWLAFWRTTVDGCSPEEVAEELDISRWSVYKARSRVLHRLRSELEGLEEL